MNLSGICHDHESRGIDLIYFLFQHNDFFFIYHTEQHQFVLPGLHSLCIDPCDTSVQVINDHIGNFIRLSGDNISCLGEFQTFDESV